MLFKSKAKTKPKVAKKTLDELYGKFRKNGRPQKGLSFPVGQKSRFDGVSLGRDKNGVFCYTHRARSKSYKSVESIPQKEIKWIESTG